MCMPVEWNLTETLGKPQLLLLLLLLWKNDFILELAKPFLDLWRIQINDLMAWSLWKLIFLMEKAHFNVILFFSAMQVPITGSLDSETLKKVSKSGIEGGTALGRHHSDSHVLVSQDKSCSSDTLDSLFCCGFQDNLQDSPNYGSLWEAHLTVQRVGGRMWALDVIFFKGVE